MIVAMLGQSYGDLVLAFANVAFNSLTQLSNLSMNSLEEINFASFSNNNILPDLLKTENLKIFLPYIHITCSPQGPV